MTAAIDWQRVAGDLDAHGWADLGPLLTDAEMHELQALYPADRPWRSHVRMQRHGFGQGEYKYFADPLPEPVRRLRAGLYPPLAAIADGWEERLGSTRRFPPDHAALRELCRAHGQTRPTPLVLKYTAGDYNCLHQDVYGPACFPLQVVVLLSDPATFSGGELVLVEQRPRQQSRAEVVPLAAGRGIVFAVDQRPRQGSRGTHRVRQRHGVSRIRKGERMTLGIIFHDAA